VLSWEIETIFFWPLVHIECFIKLAGVPLRIFPNGKWSS